MLSAFFNIMLYACLLVSLISFLLQITQNNRALTFQRLLNIGISLLIITTGFIGFTTHKTLIIDLPRLFLIPKPSLYLDSISSFFIFLTGLSYCGISFFSTSYFKQFNKVQQQKIHLFETLFIFSMLLVFTANDSFTFLFSWEVMALTSYFLVVSLEPCKQTRRAGFLYLGIAHVGFFAIVMSFYLLTIHGNIFTLHFNQITASIMLSQPLANMIFIFALIGFGAKAGLFPLHVWLPEAHPAAPSPISALMSSVMLKTAIYGFIRFSFDFLLPYQQLWWGYSLIGLGLITMLIGVIHSAMQTDMKRLLAYSSMENIGFIATTLGLAIIFYQYGLYTLSSLALLVVFLQCLNHSIFKSLLFLATGSILHATGERQLGKLGGLIHKMPWISACALVGAFSMAGLPLFNGFISEWLYLGIFFHHQPAPFLIAILSPIIIALSVLVFALAGFVAVKFYGIAFLGQSRESALRSIYPSTWLERAGLLWLALLCITLGLWPNVIIRPIQTMISHISQLKIAIHTQSIFLQLPKLASHGFSPLLLGIGLGVLLMMIFVLLKYLSPSPIRRAPSWNGGFNELNSRMQESAEGFGQPFKGIFEKLISVKLTLPTANDCHPYYHSQLTEKIWAIFYVPLTRVVVRMAALTKWIQQGRITAYLLYISMTLFILLIWVVGS